ncbi:hypothetical protein ACP70R_019506 [Stipagrostis hirtigluma subsp. patula]
MDIGVSIASRHNLSSNSVDPAAHVPQRLLHVSFNQDGGCFAAGTTAGFRIYNCDPFREIIRRDLFNTSAGRRGGVGTVEMLFRTNILALIVGGGGDDDDPQHPPSGVMLWDDQQSRCVGSLSCGGSPARGVRILHDCVATVTDSSVSVYDLHDLGLLHRYETSPNPLALCAMAPLGPGRVLACPGPREGQVRVEHLGDALRTRSTTLAIDAHPASSVACVALSRDGRLVATAGTGAAAVNVFDAHDGKLLLELEASLAGATSEVYSLAFSGDSRFLATSGDGGAVQVFGLPAEEGQDRGASSHGIASHFRTGGAGRCIVTFGALSNTVVVVGMDGSFCRCRFDPVNGGQMALLERRDFM